MIKHGFLIEGDKIYDTKIATYKLNKKFVGKNLIFFLTQSGYKRLNIFEPLLEKFEPEKVCDILNFNSDIRKERQKIENVKTDNHTSVASWSVIYNYPPSALMPHKFNTYKKCQKIKRQLD